MQAQVNKHSSSKPPSHRLTVPSMEHTLGPNCRLNPVPQTSKVDGMPPVEAQFFYSSLIPIDDPLSTGSAVSSSDPKSAKGQLRPFSHGDNNLLENAWLSLMCENDRNQHEDARKGRSPGSTAAKAYTERRDLVVQTLALKHWHKHRGSSHVRKLSMPTIETSPRTSIPSCCPDLAVDVLEELRTRFCGVARKKNTLLSVDVVVQDVIAAIARHRRLISDLDSSQPDSLRRASLNRTGGDIISSGLPTSPRGSKPSSYGDSEATRCDYPHESSGDSQSHVQSEFQLVGRSSRSQTPIGVRGPGRALAGNDGISGKPFVRVGSVEQPPQLTPSSLPRSDVSIFEGSRVEDDDYVEMVHKPGMEGLKPTETAADGLNGKDSVEVVVGVSRLHMVSLPTLQMKPIYWSPVNDVAIVTRGTWFYRDTMLPVPPAVANQLEAGYHELRPWTETWSDEIRCAIEVGALGEEKVSHRLWAPIEADGPYQGIPGTTEPLVSSDPFCSARCFQGEAAAEGSIDAPRVNDEDPAESSHRAFSSYHVIYKDETSAFLLKPSLRPSAHYNRRPVLKIMKGLTVGIPVVRGFNQQAWDHIHGRKQAQAKPNVTPASELLDNTGQTICPACKAEKDRGQITDLVLVAHGIGQKIAERVESFHFTHAINGFRRAVNIELNSPVVQQVLRDGQNGLMILPLNWRLGLSFEDGGPTQEENKSTDTNVIEPFGLKDIEPDTIPAVRSMISDVMFDIPFYMSHHKGKMIKALISEANRVYRLWCRNNPGFADNGRVHLIAHSLGSVMAIEILSRQPTSVPRIDLSRPELETRFFEFDTTNLFLLGSPAGFFLLLERGALIPRRGRLKPGADAGDTIATNVVGEAGTFGCLAVDNIYNILAKEDPIAYLLNGAVDSTYAASLKMAYVPSISVSLLKYVGDAVRNIMPGMSPSPNPLMLEPERPSTVRLPSQLELEVHDFTREEVAEKKAFLLNDNGQIDWFLRSGGGPLEIQYLNMLSAHSSYWTSSDFIRMLCMEIGRKPGRANTLPAMRAVKALKRHLPAVK